MNRVSRITRYPIKAHGCEDLPRICLEAGKTLPWDRRWAVAHEKAKLSPGWSRCSNFTRGAKAPQLMALSSRFEAQTGQITVEHPAQGRITFHPDDPAEAARFVDWTRPLIPEDHPAPSHLVLAEAAALTDNPKPFVSLHSESSLRALAEQAGLPLAPERFRGNLWVEGAPPFEELDWIGQEIALGEVRLQITEPINRCMAPAANTKTGLRDADPLSTLRRAYGHSNFGVFAMVVRGGELRVGDRWHIV